jgi:hypothetical protein
VHRKLGFADFEGVPIYVHMPGRCRAEKSGLAPAAMARPAP